MTQHTLTRSCGHTATHNILGTNANGERESRKGWLESRLCDECYRAEQAAKAAESNAALPALTGSEKQIAWAEQIRAKAVAGLKPLRDKVAPRFAEDPETAGKILGIIDEVLNTTDARVWIDNRDVVYGQSWLGRQMRK